MKEQRQLIEIYKRIAQLKREGIKMKDIASATHLAPSVLSALYATVLPVFCAKVEQQGFDGALDEALSNVNNLSRKRLMGMLDELHAQVMQFQSLHSFASAEPIHPFLQFLQNETENSATKLGSLEGMYMSYSCSSSVRALKAESHTFPDGAAALPAQKSLVYISLSCVFLFDPAKVRRFARTRNEFP